MWSAGKKVKRDMTDETTEDEHIRTESKKREWCENTTKTGSLAVILCRKGGGKKGGRKGVRQRVRKFKTKIERSVPIQDMLTGMMNSKQKGRMNIWTLKKSCTLGRFESLRAWKGGEIMEKII